MTERCWHCHRRKAVREGLCGPCLSAYLKGHEDGRSVRLRSLLGALADGAEVIEFGGDEAPWLDEDERRRFVRALIQMVDRTNRELARDDD